MIPDLPEGMGEREVLMFYDTLSGNLSSQSEVHMHWHTHRGNPSVCWICDQTTLISRILSIALGKYTKSTVDMVTSEDQDETDSEPEIENLNFDEERTPEYDTDDTEEVEEV